MRCTRTNIQTNKTDTNSKQSQTTLLMQLLPIYKYIDDSSAFYHFYPGITKNYQLWFIFVHGIETFSGGHATSCQQSVIVRRSDVSLADLRNRSFYDKCLVWHNHIAIKHNVFTAHTGSNRSEDRSMEELWNENRSLVIVLSKQIWYTQIYFE